MSRRNVLIVGATGKQGGAVIQALGALPMDNPPLHILALTRNASSPGAAALAAAYGGELVELVQGDVTKPGPIFESRPKGSVSAMFVVTTPGGKVAEEDQAIPLIDAAVEHGVQHIVFSSVERGGDDRSWTNPTNIKHFREKHNIELYLRDKAVSSKKFTWTIIRPVAFFENWSPGFFGAMFSALLSAKLKPDTKLQLVSVHDIGLFAAAALADPAKWAGRAFGLAGDALTLAEAKEKFKSFTGIELPQTWSILAKSLMLAVGDVGEMISWFETEGYAADIEARRREMATQDFETWLQESSPWRLKM